MQGDREGLRPVFACSLQLKAYSLGLTARICLQSICKRVSAHEQSRKLIQAAMKNFANKN